LRFEIKINKFITLFHSAVTQIKVASASCLVLFKFPALGLCGHFCLPPLHSNRRASSALITCCCVLIHYLEHFSKSNLFGECTGSKFSCFTNKQCSGHPALPASRSKFYLMNPELADGEKRTSNSHQNKVSTYSKTKGSAQ